ncbi:MAG: choice-of-anchor L domain-containing protein [Planctomycetes bacterium]|nr:choice-of-anchor L domain-containing protein [Planctomycetota bacterium]
MHTPNPRCVRVLVSALPLFALPFAPSAAQSVSPAPPSTPRIGTPRVAQTSLVAGLVTNDLSTGGLTPNGLVQALVGTGVSVSNITYHGAPIAAGTFTGGTGIVGFAQGIVLSSGDIASVVGPQNTSPSTSTDNLLLGDPDLDALVTGATQDASVLEFDFSCPTASVISFQYVFASEEFDEWVNSSYNDVFAFFLNGQNIALIPNTTTPVAINNVNCGNPYAPPGGANCALYETNDCESLGFGFPCSLRATEMDGQTHVFSAVGTLQPGTNHIKLAIADRGDGVYDSNVFIRGQSFTCGTPTPGFDPPSPCGETISVNPEVALTFTMNAIATNGLPGQAVTLTATGSAAALNGGTFFPALPVGPAATVETEYDWKPGSGDVGTHVLHFVSTDQIGQTASCDVTIVVSDTGTNFCEGGSGGVPCPCNNNADDGHGCKNSLFDTGALLTATGMASVAADSVLLTAEHMTGGTCVFFQGTAAIPPVIVDDGIGCVGGTVVRLGTKAIASNASAFPAAGDPAISVRGAVPVAGATRYYQAFYRNAAATFCPPSTSNRTNGVEIGWSP